MPKRYAVVAGAGIGGLSAALAAYTAARLALRGLDGLFNGFRLPR